MTIENAPRGTARALLLAVAIAALPHAGAEDAPPPAAPKPREGVYDPWEGYNRAMFKFNLKVDHAVLRPLARGYRDAVPSPVRTGFSNFLNNLENPLNMINNLLQGHPIRAGSDLLRFATNLTVGVGGFLDPATRYGLTQHDEDFGQTLGKWGIGDGPYLVLPFMPPRNLRDWAGAVPDSAADPFSYVTPDVDEYALKGFDIVETRYRVLDLDETLDTAYDPYAFVRDALTQRRAYKVRDGAPATPAAGSDATDPYADPYADPAEETATPAEGSEPAAAPPTAPEPSAPEPSAPPPP